MPGAAGTDLEVNLVASAHDEVTSAFGIYDRISSLTHSATASTPGTYGFLLGDAANAIHFWPVRGLNSGLASAISLARSLDRAWRGRAFCDSDFLRHEAMSML